ncbi:MAG TPA: S8 family serine peptidase, partial [Chloroflexota bacterium]|nr:S8 family serine peptidase [Chloroflexota bacterium]
MSPEPSSESPVHSRWPLWRGLSRLGWSGWLDLAPWLLAAFILATLLAFPADSQASPNADNPGSNAITITDTGFQPAAFTVVAGQSVHWTNNASQSESVTADDGLFDSGSLAPNAGFSMAIAYPGDHTYHSTANGAFTGTLHVVLAGLAGPGTDLANNHIPNLTFPPADPSDVSPHPRWGIMASRTRILVSFAPTATVTEANAALTGANVVVRGGVPDLGILLVTAPDTPDFSGLTGALASLRANPAVSNASMSPQVGFDALPLATNPPNWNWNVAYYGSAGEPFGDGGNWGLKASRFPEAWNFLEAIQRRAPAVDVAIIDSGFQTHGDLPSLSIEETLCQPLVLGSKQCTTNTPAEHGNMTAGIVQWGDPALARGQLHGVPDGNFSATGALTSNGVILVDQVLEIYNLVLGGSGQPAFPNLRVINYSAHAISFTDANGKLVAGPDGQPYWWKSFPNPTCGPNGTDYCTPANEPGWQTEFAAIGKVAQKIAESAAAKNVMIVQSAANDSLLFCTPPPVGTTPPPCTPQPIPAQSSAEFAWASAHWTSGEPNPIVVVEATGGSTGPGLARAAFSNTNGDLAAPGVKISSTALNDTYDVASGTSFAAPHVTALIGLLLADDPALTIPQVRAQLTTWARPNLTTGAAPRIDAFASLLSLPGAVKDLVDVNDQSADGDRRVIYDTQGKVIQQDQTLSSQTNPYTSSQYRTAPDGKIDMRDFRRFRDAWLDTCLLGQNGASDGCPAASTIVLDGSPNNVKKDLNFDGCVN